MFNIFTDGDYVNSIVNRYVKLNEGSVKVINYDITDNIISFYGDLTWTVGEDNNSACALFTQGPSNSIMFRSLKDYNIKNGIIFKRNNNSTWQRSIFSD